MIIKADARKSRRYNEESYALLKYGTPWVNEKNKAVRVEKISAEEYVKALPELTFS